MIRVVFSALEKKSALSETYDQTGQILHWSHFRAAGNLDNPYLEFK